MRHQAGRLGRSVERIGQPGQRIERVFVSKRQCSDRATGRCQLAGATGVGEERHRRARANQHKMLKALEQFNHLFGKVRQLLDPDLTASAAQARREGVAHQLRAGGCRDPPGKAEPVGQEGPAPEQ